MNKSGMPSWPRSERGPSLPAGSRLSAEAGREDLDSVRVCSRLRNAREAAGLTQASAADAIGVARTTLVAIEKGQRPWRPLELQRLAVTYGTSANELLRREAVHIDLAPRFRKLTQKDDKDAEEAVRTLVALVRAEVELENLLGIRRAQNYPAERPILPGNLDVQAAADATEVREKLGLGLAPIRDLVSLLEFEVGVRVYTRPLGAHISGLFAHDPGIGACILVNANHPYTRRAQTLAHEFGHLVSVRSVPSIHYFDPCPKAREERYAGAFGRAFLTPARAVERRFSELTANSSFFTRRHVILLSHAFGVSREAIVRRLEELELVRRGTWDWFEDQGGISNQQAEQVLGDLAGRATDSVERRRPTTLRLAALAAGAHEKGLLSEGQLARLLRLGRVELRGLLDDETAGGAANAVRERS